MQNMPLVTAASPKALVVLAVSHPNPDKVQKAAEVILNHCGGDDEEVAAPNRVEYGTAGACAAVAAALTNHAAHAGVAQYACLALRNLAVNNDANKVPHRDLV